MTSPATPRIGILHEHPDWFQPLFVELEDRGIAVDRLDARSVTLDPGSPPGPYTLVFNRMSPSGFQRGAAPAVFATADLLAAWEAAGVPVVNGSRAWAVECSKIRQLRLLRELGLAHPEARFVQPAGIRVAAREIGYPLVLKPNVGGSGAGIVRVDDDAGLAAALAGGGPDLGPTGVGLVQRYVRPRGGCIQRVEVLEGEVLYGIRVHAPEGEFNLCPADACRTTDGRELTRGACAVDAADQGLRVESFDVEPQVAREAVAIMDAAGIEVGGAEFTIDADTGERLWYDVNALSNFVADGPAVLGFDPFARLVDALERRLRAAVPGGGVPRGREPDAGGPSPAPAGEVAP
jgi:hypothetical protein